MGEVDCIEIEEDEANLFSGIYKKILLYFSATTFGQYAIKHVEHALWSIEKTAKWSLPVNSEKDKRSKSIKEGKDTKDIKESENKEKNQKAELVRPLPWIIFLFTIITLRIIRTYLSIIAVLIGRNSVTSQAMVCFIQKRRRRMRALKYQGQRMIRIRKINEKKKEANNSFTNINLLSIIFSIIKPVLCTNPYYVESDKSMEIHDDDADTMDNDKQSTRKKQYKHKSEKKNENQSSKKRTIDEVNTTETEDSDENLSCNKLLDKYAGDSSDSSFKIVEETDSGNSCSEDSETEDAFNNSYDNEKELQPEDQEERAESEQTIKSPELKRESPAPASAATTEQPKAITAKEKKTRKKALKKQRSDEQKSYSSSQHTQSHQNHSLHNTYYPHDPYPHNHQSHHHHSNYHSQQQNPTHYHPQQQPRYYFNHKHQYNTLQKKRSMSPERTSFDQRNEKPNNNQSDNNSEGSNSVNNSQSNASQDANNVENGSNGNNTNKENNDDETHNKSNDNYNEGEDVNIITNNTKHKRPKNGSWSDDIFYSPIGSPTPTSNDNENGNYDDNSQQQNEGCEKSEPESR